MDQDSFAEVGIIFAEVSSKQIFLLVQKMLVGHFFKTLSMLR